MKFSICIPNYNYSKYIKETVNSVLAQTVNLEILLSDNCSTDGSVAEIESINDARISLKINPWNVGFAGNLDRACAEASGDRMLLLSSDDRAEHGSLSKYERLADLLGDQADQAIFASDQYVIDADGKVLGQDHRNLRLWVDAYVDQGLTEQLGCRVFRVPASTLLKRSLSELRTPFYFATTCYPRSLYEAVCGYGGQSLMNPDKAFAWKILSLAKEAIYIEAPLFSYRVHAANQNSQQLQSGALKHLMDQYCHSFNTDAMVLEAANLDNEVLASAFIEHDIGLRGLKALGEGNRVLARRHLLFGSAAYPQLMRRNTKVWALRIALLMGPIGRWICESLLDRALIKFRELKKA